MSSRIGQGPDELLAEAELALEEAGDDLALEHAWLLIEKALGAARDANDRELLEDAWSLALETFTESPGVRERHARLLPGAIERDLGAGATLARLGAGLVAFYGADFMAAGFQLGAVCAAEPENAFAWFYLGCASERLGTSEDSPKLLDDARRQLARAHRLEPDAYGSPIELTPAELDAAVDEALAELPPEIAGVVGEECVIEVHDFPDERLVKEGVDPLVLGLFVGLEHGERSIEAADAPSQILLFRRNLEKECRSRDELVDEIRVTLFHEIGHALGFDEDGVDELGLA